MDDALIRVILIFFGVVCGGFGRFMDLSRALVDDGGCALIRVILIFFGVVVFGRFMDFSRGPLGDDGGCALIRVILFFRCVV